MPDVRALLAQLADLLSPAVADAFVTAVDTLQALVTVEALAAVIEAAGRDPARLAAGLDALVGDAATGPLAASVQPVREALRAVTVHGGQVAAASAATVLAAAPPLPTGPAAPNAPPAPAGGAIQVVFNVTNPRAVQMVAAAERELFGVYAADVRAGARALVADAVADGLNPRQAAARVRPLLGLTAAQADILDNARRELLGLRGRGPADFLARANRDRRFDRTIQRAAAGGGALTPDQVDRVLSAAARVTLRKTAETLARTESLNALRRANQEAWRQALEQQGEDPGDYVRVWHTNLDGRERPAHHAMHGRAVAFGEPWDVPGVGPEAYPGEGEFNCRCAETIVPRWLYEAQQREAA